MNNIIREKQLKIGDKVYFEDGTYQGDGVIHYFPTEKEQEFQRECHGENAISVKPENGGNARFVPISQIILL